MADRLSVLKYYLYYKYRRAFSDRKELMRYQEKKLKQHLNYVSGHSPFYKGKRSLEDISVIQKSVMMEHFNEINTLGIDRDEAMEFALKAERERDFVPKLQQTTIGLSSGTSGSRGIFLVSDQEKSRWAGYILARFLPGGILGRYPIAFFMRADSNLYEAVNTGRIQFHFFDIYKDMEVHKKKLEALKPRILVGQPSVLLMLAKESEAGTLKIMPEVVISIAEVLEQKDEQRLKKGFGLPVIHQVYQCTEGCLASTCRCGTLHLNEDIVLVEREYLDDKRFVPVITDFMRRAQPVIRYRLNDILVEKKEGCACRSPHLALEKIEGREDDVFMFGGKHGRDVVVFPDFIRRCMLFAGSVQDYRIVQMEDGSLSVYADLTEELTEKVLAEFRRLSEDMQFYLPEIVFAPYSLEKGRKMKRVERRIIYEDENTCEDKKSKTNRMGKCTAGTGDSVW